MPFPTVARWRGPDADCRRAELAADVALHAAVAVYLVAAGLLAVALGATDRFVPFLYLRVWVLGSLSVGLVGLLVLDVPAAIRADPRRPLTGAMIGARARLGRRLWPGIALILSTSVFYGTFTSVKNMLPLLAPHWLDKPLADLGLLLHGGYRPWSVLNGVMGYPAVTRFVEFLYVPVWLLLVVGFPTFLAMSARHAGLRARYFLTMFLCFVLLGNVLAGLGMTAGPVFYGHVTGDHARFKPLLDYLSFSSGLPFSAWDRQQFLWDCLASGEVAKGTGISAFPSMHVAMATLFALAGRVIDRRLGFALAGYWLATLVGSMHLGWHYSLDGYASTLGTAAIWWATGRMLRRPGAARGDAPTLAAPLPAGLPALPQQA